ncbi:MAG: hypothetical protein VB855_05415 [Pirellulaceae bacterium]
MQSNTKIILKMVFFIALPIGLLQFLLGSVVPKQMGWEKETLDTLQVFINLVGAVVNPLCCVLYALKQTRRNAAARASSEADEQ